MVRLFAGLALPETHRQRLELLCHGVKGARWVAPENLHITLSFIGEVDEPQAEDLARALSAVRAEPFAITVAELGTFGHPPHNIWAGVNDEPTGALAALHANVESVLVREGLEPEHRKYTPHVTLAYCRKASESRIALFLEGSGAVALEPIEVNGSTLFQSHLSPEGAHYERIVEYDFL